MPIARSNPFDIRVVEDNAPDWVLRAISMGWTVGQWLAISGPSPTGGYGLTPTNVLEDAKTTPVRGGGLDGIIDEWCGGWIARNVRSHGLYGVGRGGGHMGYVGNDVFGFDLATRVWEETIPDSPGGEIDRVHGEYADGSPLGSHNAAWWFYNERTRELGMVKSWMDHALGSDAASVPWGHSIDLARVLDEGYSPSMWRRHGEETPGGRGLTQQCGSVYNPNDGKIWFECAHNSYSDSGAFTSYDPVTDSYELYAQPWSSSGAAFLQSGFAIDPVRNVWLAGAFRGDGPMTVRDLGNPSRNRVTDNAGTAADASWYAVEHGAPSRIAAAGIEYSAAYDGFVYYGAQDGSPDVWLARYTGPATPSFPEGADTDYALTWERLDSPSNAVRPASMRTPNGNFNRFRLARWGTIEVAFIVQDVNVPVNAFLVSV